MEVLHYIGFDIAETTFLLDILCLDNKAKPNLTNPQLGSRDSYSQSEKRGMTP
jgi:hypothetical protein